VQRVLIANRGEIAVRIIRGCRALGLSPSRSISEVDRAAPHVLAADAAVCVGPPPARESYLNTDAILAAAKATGADAVHPGYGFFSENAAFAEAVERAGLTWIGPSPHAIATMGDKLAARATVAKAGVPLVPAPSSPSATRTRRGAPRARSAIRSS
jgi:acetyl/propionyl-CoA carboxylase alpha subunit